VASNRPGFADGLLARTTDALDGERVMLPASVRLVIIGGEKALLERVRVWQHSPANLSGL